MKTTDKTLRHKWRPFKDARAFAHSLELKNWKEWHEWAKSDARPNDIPANPRIVYKIVGWAGVGDWLGTGYIPTYSRVYRSFEEARAFVHSLGLNNYSEWRAWSKSKSRPDDIPTNPNKIYKDKGFSGEDLQRVVKIITSDKDRWAKEMMIHELGIIPDGEESPWKNGLATFVAFASAGLLPLLPYVFNIAIKDTFTTAIIFTGVALFIVGAGRTVFTKKNWLLAGLEMLAVGAIAAGAAYTLGYWIDSLI